MKTAAILGAGHSGFAMAAHLAYNGVRVRLWNRSKSTVDFISESKKIKISGIIDGTAELNCVTCNMAEAIENVDMILVTTPASAHKDIAKSLAPILKSNIPILLNPGRTFGALEFAQVLKNAGCVINPQIAEAQTIIYTCRKLDCQSVHILTMKRSVPLYEFAAQYETSIISQLPEFIRECFSLSESMAFTSFGNVGMILHCAPTLLNAGWIESDSVNFKYYYEGITPSISSLLEKMDCERQSVSAALGYGIESVKQWLARTYNVSGKSLYDCIHNNVYYQTIDAPQSLDHRYINEDIPCGLVPVEHLARQMSIPTPHISMVIDLAGILVNIDFRETGRKIPLETVKEALSFGQ